MLRRSENEVAPQPASGERPEARRVCMVVHAYYPIGEPRVQREAKAAAEAGYRVDVVCLRQPGEARRETVDGIDVHRLPIVHDRSAGAAKMAVEYARFALRATVAVGRLMLGARTACERVVQVHSPPDFLIIAGILPKLLGARLVLDIHDLSTHLYRARFARRGLALRLANLTLALIERAACAFADDVITVHEPYRAELISHGVSGSNITVVMNAVDERLIEHTRRAEARARSNGGFTIAYHGTITPSYGVDLIVEALPHVCELVPDARCVILGEGDALVAIEQRAEDLGVADRIEFSRRYLPIERALERVASADCGVIPNRPSEYNRFALSSKLFEYVALGIPAVVARLETLAAHFGPDQVSFFAPGDAAGLGHAISWVAQNRAAAKRMAVRARIRGREYSWFEHRRRYLDVIASPEPRPPRSVARAETPGTHHRVSLRHGSSENCPALDTAGKEGLA
jgi:glycosyltransferase involved in cell wall biosynthesis